MIVFMGLSAGGEDFFDLLHKRHLSEEGGWDKCRVERAFARVLKSCR